LALHAVQRRENRHAFGENGSAGERKSVLREIPGGNAFHHAAAAVVERLGSGENLKQRGFPSPVGADQAGALFRRDQPVQIFKQDLRTEALACAGKLEHSNTIVVGCSLAESRAAKNRAEARRGPLSEAWTSCLVTRRYHSA